MGVRVRAAGTAATRTLVVAVVAAMSAVATSAAVWSSAPHAAGASGAPVDDGVEVPVDDPTDQPDGEPIVVPADEEAALRAAREISAARERANTLAEALWEARSAYDVLVEEELRLEVEIARVEERVAELETDVRSVAVARFVASGATGIPVLTDVKAPNERVRADVLVGVVADVGATAVDDYDAARAELGRLRDELVVTREGAEREQERLERLRVDAEQEVARLRELEQQRLQDEAVQRALEAERREQERRRAEAARREAEAALLAAQQAEDDEDDADDAGGSGAGESGAGESVSGIGGAPEDLGADVPPAGGAGATGSGGRLLPDGSSPAGRTEVPGTSGSNGVFVDRILCPVVGGSAYGDTWGAPRSGGRRHQGVDMIAPTGTPLIAVVSGTTEHRTNRLGGTTIALAGDNGHRYYYAHLSRYEGPAGPVVAGDVIGYVGDTGNATGIPHLHFEIRPGGGVPVNPTPSVRAAGC